MQLQTHLLAGWCLAGQPTRTSRERFLCMLVGVLPDLDGAGILIDVKYYHQYHHILGHTIFFGILSSALLARFSTNRWQMFWLFLAIFHSHILLDLLGSGDGWGMQYFWPASSWVLENPYVWELQSWQCMAVMFFLLLWTIRIAYVRRCTPFEFLLPKLDSYLVHALIRFVEK